MNIEKDLAQLKVLRAVFDNYSLSIGNKVIMKHELERQITLLEEKIDFVKQLKEHEDQILGKFNLSKYFVLQCWLDEDNGEFYASLELADEVSNFVYNNFISSHSGIREWVEIHFCHVYDFLSGNSQYNFALGTKSFKNHLEELSKMTDVNKIKNRLDAIKSYFLAEENKHMVSALDAIIDSAWAQML
jgi:hypothetical protein